MPTEPKPGIIRPPAIFYEAPITTPTDQTIAAQRNITYITEKIEATPNGIMKYNRGMLFPEKGWPTPEAMWNCNIVKRVLIGAILAPATPASALPIIGFLLTPWKWKIRLINRALEQFNHTCDWILSTSYYKEEIYSSCPKEIKKFLYLFLYYLGIDAAIAKLFAKIFSTLIETDNAYRYRIEDIMSETTQAALIKNPRKEIERLIALFLERQQEKLTGRNVSLKFYLPGKILSYALLIPKIRRAFRKTTQEIDITALQLDEGDHYHVLIRDGYKYLGRTMEDRLEEWDKIHNGNPPQPVEYSLN